MNCLPLVSAALLLLGAAALPVPAQVRDKPGGPGTADDRPAVEISDELWEPLLQVLDGRRPELARKLREMRERDPDRAADVLAHALGSRVEEALDGRPPGGNPFGPGLRRRPGDGPPGARRGDGPRGDGPPGRPGMRPPRGGEGPEGGPPPGAEVGEDGEPPFPPGHEGPPGEGDDTPFGPGRPGDGGPRPPRPPGPRPDPEMRELHGKQAEADRATREIAARLRAARGGQSGEDAGSIEQELRTALEQQFELRGKLRARELQRIEEDIQRLQKRVASIREDLERRDTERQEIIERRVRELSEEKEGGR